MDDPVTQWLCDLRQEGNEEAAHRLWERYFEQLVRVAEGKLPLKLRRAFDGQDVAQSALISFFEGMEQDRFPRLEDRHNLWGLLVVITSRKAFRYLEKEQAQKAGGGNVRGESAFQPLHQQEAGRGIEAILGSEPTPEKVAQMSEEFDRLLASLPNDQYRRIALLRMEGYSIPEISAEIDLPRRTVDTRLQIIRELWLPPDHSDVPE